MKSYRSQNKRIAEWILLLRLRSYFKSLAALLLSLNTSSQKQGSTAYTPSWLTGDEALAAATEENRLEFLIHTPTKTSHYWPFHRIWGWILWMWEYTAGGIECILKRMTLSTGFMTQHKSIYSDLKSHKDSTELDILNTLIWVQGQRLEEMKCGKNQWFSH